MKRILLILSLFISSYTFAQYPTTQVLGSDSAIVKAKGGFWANKGMVNGYYIDTAAANFSRISQYPQAQIVTDTGTLYIRNNDATGWNRVIPAAGFSSITKVGRCLLVRSMAETGAPTDSLLYICADSVSLNATGDSLITFYPWPNQRRIAAAIAGGGGGGIDSVYVSSDSLYQIFIYNSGRVDSFAIYGSSGSIDTTSLSNRINLKLNIADTVNRSIRPIAGTNMTITGTFPNLTFNASGGAGGGAGDSTHFWPLTGKAISYGQFLGTTNLLKTVFKQGGTTKGYIDSLTNGWYLDGIRIWAGNGANYANIGIGDSALARNTAANNTAFGDSSLRLNSTGAGNTGVGSKAVAVNTIGGYITGIGYLALTANTIGDWNTAVGGEALKTNTSGNYNAAFGVGALKLNSTGSYNTAVGVNSLVVNTGSGNTAIGFGALGGNTSGSGNVAIGQGASGSTSTGTNNLAIGTSTLGYNNTGSYNIAMGGSSLIYSTTGTAGIGLGYFAQRFNTTGWGNIAIGHSALSQSGNYINSLGSITGGSGYTNGSYSNVTLTALSGTVPLSPPFANITVSGGAVTAVTITVQGTRLDNTTVLTTSAASIGGTGSGFSVPVSSSTPPGSLNIAIGDSAATTLNNGASSNIIIGAFVEPASFSGTGQLNIGNVIYGTNLYSTSIASSTATASGNIGIGGTPNAAAKLQLISTTQGFIPSIMTATQASAITPTKGLILYVSDTNGTFTSAGLWIYTTLWKLIIAE